MKMFSQKNQLINLFQEALKLKIIILERLQNKVDHLIQKLNLKFQNNMLHSYFLLHNFLKNILKRKNLLRFFHYK